LFKLYVPLYFDIILFLRRKFLLWVSDDSVSFNFAIVK
jgi:hypothetical protein